MKYEERVGIITGKSYPDHIPPEYISACNLKDKGRKNDCIKLFKEELSRREENAGEAVAIARRSLESAQEKEIDRIYNEALNQKLVLPIVAVPTMQEKRDAIITTFEKISNDYTLAQASVDEYHSHWTGGSKLVWWNNLDPQLSHAPHYQGHAHLKTERRSKMWDAINGKGEWAGDLKDDYSEIHDSCIVSPDIHSICKQSIEKEMRARREKDKKAQEAKQAKEAITKIHDKIKALDSTLEEAKKLEAAQQELAKFQQVQKDCEAHIAKMDETTTVPLSGEHNKWEEVGREQDC
jgi:hypothetical protein